MGACQHLQHDSSGYNVTAADITTWVAVLFGGGGLWLAVREIAKQIGETKRARINADKEIATAVIARKYPLPEDRNRPAVQGSQAETA